MQKVLGQEEHYKEEGKGQRGWSLESGCTSNWEATRVWESGLKEMGASWTLGLGRWFSG